MPPGGEDSPTPPSVTFEEVARSVLARHAPAVIGRLDLEERLVHLEGALLVNSPQWQALIGKSLDEFITDEGILDIVRGGIAGHDGHGVAQLNGRSWLVAAHPVRDRAGDPAGAAVLFTYADVGHIHHELTLAATANEQFKAVVELSRDFIAIARLDGRITYVNQAGRHLVGLDDTGEPDLTTEQLFTEEAVRAGSGSFTQGMRTDGYWTGASTLRHQRTAEPIPVTVEAFLVTRASDGARLGLATVLRDRRAQLQAEADLNARIQEQRSLAELGRAALTLPLMEFLDESVEVLRARFVGSVAAVLRLAPTGDVMESVASTIPGWVEVVPVAPESLTGLSLARDELIHTRDVFEDPRFPGDPISRTAYGLRSSLICPITRAHQPWGMIGIGFEQPRAWTEDDTAVVESLASIIAAAVNRHELENRLQHQALHDPLTGLPNRALLTDRIDHALGQAFRRGTMLAVVLLDLDDFKVVNDTLGHEHGDDLLTELALRFAKAVREGDTVARLGGDEFVVLCEDLGSEQDVGFVAEALLEACKADVDLAGRRISVSASIGVALATSGEASTAELLSEADIAMYRAKRDRPGTYRIFDEAMRGDVLGRINVAGQLRATLRADALEAAYQPIVDLATGQVVAFEALARWRDESGVMVPPDVFVPVAEETGLIGDLGALMLRRALREAIDWLDVAEVGVRVNTSAHELRSRTFRDQVMDALAETGYPAHLLGLEITESVLVEDDKVTQDNLGRLRDAGVRLLVDDFGTGFSSLSYLHRFPVVDVLKVDRSFLEEDTRGSAVVEAVVGLGRAFGLQVCAEGVETPEQHALVADLGCHLAQGYLLSRPVPADQVRGLLETWQPVLPPSAR